MKYLVIVLFLVFIALNGLAQNQLKQFSAQMLQVDELVIKASNINCHKRCLAEDVLYCDSIGVINDTVFAPTLELPLREFSAKDSRELLYILSNDTLNMSSYGIGGNTFLEFGSCNCIYVPKIALIFQNPKSRIVAQLMLDLISDYAILYRNGVPHAFWFYGWAKSHFEKIFKKYDIDLECGR